jgi:hypothetical protein
VPVLLAAFEGADDARAWNEDWLAWQRSHHLLAVAYAWLQRPGEHRGRGSAAKPATPAAPDPRRRPFLAVGRHTVTGIGTEETTARVAAALSFLLFLLFWLLVVVLAVVAVVLAVPVSALAALAAAVVSSWRLVRLVVHTLWSVHPDGPRVLGPEPEEGVAGRDVAYRSYYVDQVFVDVWYLARSAAGVVHDLLAGRFVRGVSRWLRTGEPGTQPLPALEPLALPAGRVLSWAWVAGCGVGVFLVAAFMGVVQLVHLLLLVCVPGLVVWVGKMFAEFTGELLGRPWTTCPSFTCRRYEVIPVYECDEGHKHHHLRPGLTGVRRRICSCGQRLPTTHLGGRDKLLIRCPGAPWNCPAASGRPGSGTSRSWARRGRARRRC